MEAKQKTKVTPLRKRSRNDGPSPICKKGERNLFCPYYCHCLDVAIQKSWEFWACFDCKHKKVVQLLNEYPATNSETVLYHTLPQEFYSRAG